MRALIEFSPFREGRPPASTQGNVTSDHFSPEMNAISALGSLEDTYDIWICFHLFKMNLDNHFSKCADHSLKYVGGIDLYTSVSAKAINPAALPTVSM